MAWNLEQWRLAQALDAGYVFCKPDGVDWLFRPWAVAAGTYEYVRVGRVLRTFKEDQLVEPAADGRYAWTTKGAARFASEGEDRAKSRYVPRTARVRMA